MSSNSQPDVVIRSARLEDGSVCGQICYDAFFKINQAHGFPCDFPGPERPTGLLSAMFTNPGFYCVVAEAAGRIVGSNCLDERSMIAGVGPITVDPAVQHVGIGRKLMQAVMDRANGRHTAGMRLVQAAFHNRSLSLYTSLGFDVREPLSCLQGRTRERSIAGYVVRPARATDLDGCNALSRRVHGFDRGAELAQAIEHNTAVVVEREGHITGYASALAFFGHATAETNTGYAIAHRVGGFIRWSWNTRAIAKQRSAALVPDEWFAHRPALTLMSAGFTIPRRAPGCLPSSIDRLDATRCSLLRHPGFESHGRVIDPWLGPTCFSGHAANFLQGVSPFDQHIAEDEHHEPAVQPAYAQAFHILLDRRHGSIAAHINQQSVTAGPQHATEFGQRLHRLGKVFEGRATNHEIDARIFTGRAAAFPRSKRAVHTLGSSVTSCDLDKGFADVDRAHVQSRAWPVRWKESPVPALPRAPGPRVKCCGDPQRQSLDFGHVFARGAVIPSRGAAFHAHSLVSFDCCCHLFILHVSYIIRYMDSKP